MEGNNHNYPACLNVVVCLFTCMLGCIAVLGYLWCGDDTQQIIIMNLPQGIKLWWCSINKKGPEMSSQEHGSVGYLLWSDSLHVTPRRTHFYVLPWLWFMNMEKGVKSKISQKNIICHNRIDKSQSVFVSLQPTNYSIAWTTMFWSFYFRNIDINYTSCVTGGCFAHLPPPDISSHRYSRRRVFLI